MKRSNLSISSLLAVLVWLLCGQMWACVGGWYFPSYTESLYRADGIQATGLSKSELRERNVRLWIKQTGLPYQTVESLVYGGHLSDPDCLQGDTAATHFLRIAKRCEEARLQISSPWYYAIEGDEPQTVLLNVARESTAMAQFRGKMWERYLLQAIRAHFALRQYADCITLWDYFEASLQEPIIRDMALPYIAGCYYHLHQVKKALPIFLHYGDMESVKLCEKMLDAHSDAETENFEDASFDDNSDWHYYQMAHVLRLTAEYCPDVPDLSQKINKLIESMKVYSTYSHWDSDEYTREYVIKAAQRATGMNKGLWYYAAAILSDAMSEPDKTLSYLAEAKKCPITRKMSDYIHLLESDIYFQTAKVDSAYYQRVEQEIRWMDKCMYNSFDRHAVSENLKQCGYMLYQEARTTDEADFWNLAMRRVIISDVCPRLEEKCDYQSMLRYANFAENRYLHLCDGSNFRERQYWHYNTVTGEYEWSDSLVETTERFSYHYYIHSDNINDWNGNYRTELFAIADSLPADMLRKYISWMHRPQQGFDALLIAGSNTDKDYWNEMLGTHYIREQRFEEAAQTLSLVSTKFNECTNLYKEDCYEHNPFSTNPRKSRVKDSANYKLNFARKMAKLKKKMTQTDDDDRAEAMLQFSVGLKNSIADCWALTSYYWHCYTSPEVPYLGDGLSYYDSILQESMRLEKSAFSTFTDRELKAYALMNHHHRLEVMRDMADTEAARFIEQHCDLWRDYVRSKKEQRN